MRDGHGQVCLLIGFSWSSVVWETGLLSQPAHGECQILTNRSCTCLFLREGPNVMGYPSEKPQYSNPDTHRPPTLSPTSHKKEFATNRPNMAAPAEMITWSYIYSRGKRFVLLSGKIKNVLGVSLHTFSKKQWDKLMIRSRFIIIWTFLPPHLPYFPPFPQGKYITS